MIDEIPICERLPEGNSFAPWIANETGRYFAVVRVDELPVEESDGGRIVRHGYAVGFGKWFFFDAIEAALTFGRVARMSRDCTGYGVYAAAEETMLCCGDHHRDEWALHVAGRPGFSLDRKGREVEAAKRFAQCVKENPDSAYWHEPTGFINSSMGFSTGRPSLPL